MHWMWCWPGTVSHLLLSTPSCVLSSPASLLRPPQVDRQDEEEDKKKMADAVWVFDGHPRRFDKIVGRRKKKKGE
jgi:hypothetical protein